MPQVSSKPAPPHVAIAQSALQALESHADIVALRKLVPSLAARLHLAGQTVSVDALLQAGAQGGDAVKKIILSLKPSKSNQIAFTAGDSFSAYLANGDFEETALYPALLRSKDFQQCYVTLRHRLAHEGCHDVRQLAADAACLFANPQRLQAYLDRWTGQGVQPVYEAIQMIALPTNIKTMDMVCWREAVIQHGPKMAALVHNADIQPKPVRSSCGHNWNYHDTRYAMIRKNATAMRASHVVQIRPAAGAVMPFFADTQELSQSFNTAYPVKHPDTQARLARVASQVQLLARQP